MGGIEGGKCDSEGAKIQKFAENGLFYNFFLMTGGGGASGDRASDWGGANAPMPTLMPPLCTV